MTSVGAWECRRWFINIMPSKTNRKFSAARSLPRSSHVIVWRLFCGAFSHLLEPGMLETKMNRNFESSALVPIMLTESLPSI